MASNDISTIVGSNDIVLFQSRGCPYCSSAIGSLQAAGYKPTIVEASREQRQQLLNVTKSRSVPSIWLKGKFVGGCNDGPEPWMGINKILQNNEMDKFLA
mmetsp:Transcript_1421/g.2314  ORF Transcript_1421/g.2314 Transcript_1421/m.2314 type:complete len:100 (-) Transcript_1421:87-386(-)